MPGFVSPLSDRPVPVPRYAVSPHETILELVPGQGRVRDRFHRVLVWVDGQRPAVYPTDEAQAIADRLEAEYRAAVASGNLPADGGVPEEGGCNEWILEDQLAARLRHTDLADLIHSSWTPDQKDQALRRCAGIAGEKFARAEFDLLGESPLHTHADIPDDRLYEEACRQMRSSYGDALAVPGT